MDCQKILDEWYGMIEHPDRKIIFKAFGGVCEDWCGLTHFSSPLEIRICKQFEGHPLWSEVVLWHEFCHCWTYLDCEKYRDHGAPWISKMLVRPVMFLLQVPCAFAAILLK